MSPDKDLIDLRRRGPFMNSAVLLELSRRSVEAENLFIGMDGLVFNAASG